MHVAQEEAKNAEDQKKAKEMEVSSLSPYEGTRIF